MSQFFAAFTIALLVALTLMLVLRPVALALRLVDVPGGRKTHHGEVPVIGGVAMFLAAMAAVSAVGFSGLGETGLLVAGALTVLVGVLDDRFDLPPYTRILAHIAAAATLVLASGYTVTSFGNLLGFGTMDLGQVAFIFTIVATIALINGFNMLDGLDGLAGSVALVALAGLAVCFVSAGQVYAAIVTLAFAGAVAGFLLFNIPVKFNRPVLSFMGDAGSTMLGFSLAGVSLIAVQPDGAGVPAVVVLWLMPIPIVELFTSTFRRLMTGLSPMQADRGHFHHRLLEAGFSVKAIFILYLTVSSISAASGLLLWQAGYSDAVLFYSFVILSVIWLVALVNAKALAANLPEFLKRGRLPRRRWLRRPESSSGR
jgi:UDP-GlcNAc:undecaprenyl-phosphate GlcNAc-1-phosphate transferase